MLTTRGYPVSACSLNLSESVPTLPSCPSLPIPRVRSLAVGIPKAAARAVFVLQTSLLRFGRGSHPGFFVAPSHRPNLHARTPKSPPPAATWLPSDFLLGAVQQPISPPVRFPAIAGRPRCGKLLRAPSPTRRRHSPLQCRLATEATISWDT